MTNTLLTGANGFYAQHMLDTLLAAGHTVTGTVRSQSKIDSLLSWRPTLGASDLFLVVVPDVTAAGAYDAVLQSKPFDYVVHTASPMIDDPSFTDFDRDFLAPAVAGELRLLEGVTKYGKTVKAVTVTGSINAISDGSESAITNADWLGMTEDQAREMNQTFPSYMVSKKLAEQALWKYIKETNPHYTVSVLLPALIFAPPIQPITSIGQLNMTSKVTRGLFRSEEIQPTPFPSYIDGRDLAEAQLRCLTTPEVQGKRLLLGGMHYDNYSAAEALKKVMPELSVGKLNEAAKAHDMKLDEEGNALLGMKFRTLEETIGDVAKRVLWLEENVKA